MTFFENFHKDCVMRELEIKFPEVHKEILEKLSYMTIGFLDQPISEHLYINGDSRLVSIRLEVCNISLEEIDQLYPRKYLIYDINNRFIRIYEVDMTDQELYYMFPLLRVFMRDNTIDKILGD